MIEKFSWRKVNHKSPSSVNSRPCPRWGHSSCTIGHEVVLFGGYAQSVYMNDVWVFDTNTMQWTEIKTTGNIPSPRSNCSMSYDQINKKIIFFGGGGPSKSRFNTITFLDWETKVWSQHSYSENQKVPWERTYHTAQLLYPYLIVFGGEGIADLEDMWIFNFNTLTWTEIVIDKNQTRPCGRRFHSSCMLGNQFYVIAGCHTKYRCLNDIYSINLGSLLQTGQTTGLHWKQNGYSGTALLSRWGHSSTTLGDKIYIFGGRFSTDLNDLLIYDPQTKLLRILRASQDSLPKPRRRPSTCFVGSCLLMFGGFNSEYYNDLNYINVAENKIKSKNVLLDLYLESEKHSYIKELLNKTNDNYVKSSDQTLVPLYKDLLSSTFQDKDKIQEFLTAVDGKLCTQALKAVMQRLYLGYGKLDILSKFNIELPQDHQEKIRKVRRLFSQKILGQNLYESLSSKSKHSLNIIQLNEEEFGDIIERNRERIHKNVMLVINDEYMLQSNSHMLSLNNKYFRSLFSQKYSDKVQQKTKYCFFPIKLNSNNIVIFQIIINFILSSLLILPQNMSVQSWIEMYQMADYFCITDLQQICLYRIALKIDESSVNKIFSFSKAEGLDDLSECCAKFKVRVLNEISKTNLSEKYMKKVYTMDRFEIMQKMIENPEPKLMKHKSELTNTSQGQKQNYEFCN